MANEILLDGESLTVESVFQVASGAARVALAPAARARLVQRRRFVDEIVARHDVVYGITTGFGKLTDVAIPPDRLADLQINLVRSHVGGRRRRRSPSAKCAR